MGPRLRAKLPLFVLACASAAALVAGCASDDATQEENPLPAVAKDAGDASAGEAKAGTANQLSLNPDYNPK